MTRFTIHGMTSKILIEIWHSSSCMYSCLISYCSNQRSLASSVLDLQTRLARSASSLSDSLFADNPYPFSLINVVPQSPPEYGLFNFPLAHSICLVTSYPELLMMLPLNARSNNVSPTSLSLNLAVFLKLVPRNRATVASTTAKLRWWVLAGDVDGKMTAFDLDGNWC